MMIIIYDLFSHNIIFHIVKISFLFLTKYMIWKVKQNNQLKSWDLF